MKVKLVYVMKKRCPLIEDLMVVEAPVSWLVVLPSSRFRSLWRW